MRFLKRSARHAPRVSLVLLDWSVRESFHLLRYLENQTAKRDDFEVIVVEYYSTESKPLQQFAHQVDTWLLLEMPTDAYYHKHLMYNAGIIAARGDIIMIGDSDAMVRESFIQRIIDTFDADSRIAYHIDQFRNARRDLYPFNYPSFEEVLGEGCINNVGGRTAGVVDTIDPIHTRNYGACMCAKRTDLIAIGGADMHIDYLGHICGPYDLTFRLVNYGKREVWDMEEFTAHTWHPGAAGEDNYLGPHDGRHMSTTSLEALSSGRIAPLSENEAIRRLRTGETTSADDVLIVLIPETAGEDWRLANVQTRAAELRRRESHSPLGLYKGFRLQAERGGVAAYAAGDGATASPALTAAGEAELKAAIDANISGGGALASNLADVYAAVFPAMRLFYRGAKRLPGPLPGPVKAIVVAMLAPFGLMALLLAAPKRLAGIFLRIGEDSKDFRDKLRHIAISVSNLDSKGALKSGAPVMLMGDTESIVFMRLLRWLGGAPYLELHRVGDTRAAELALAELDQKGWSGPLLVPSDVFHRLHVAIAPSAAAQQLIVV